MLPGRGRASPAEHAPPPRLCMLFTPMIDLTTVITSVSINKQVELDAKLLILALRAKHKRNQHQSINQSLIIFRVVHVTELQSCCKVACSDNPNDGNNFLRWLQCPTTISPTFLECSMRIAVLGLSSKHSQLATAVIDNHPLSSTRTLSLCLPAQLSINEAAITYANEVLQTLHSLIIVTGLSSDIRYDDIKKMCVCSFQLFISQPNISYFEVKLLMRKPDHYWLHCISLRLHCRQQNKHMDVFNELIPYIVQVLHLWKEMSHVM